MRTAVVAGRAMAVSSLKCNGFCESSSYVSLQLARGSSDDVLGVSQSRQRSGDAGSENRCSDIFSMMRAICPRLHAYRVPSGARLMLALVL